MSLDGPKVGMQLDQLLQFGLCGTRGELSDEGIREAVDEKDVASCVSRLTSCLRRQVADDAVGINVRNKLPDAVSCLYVDFSFLFC